MSEKIKNWSCWITFFGVASLGDLCNFMHARQETFDY